MTDTVPQGPFNKGDSVPAEGDYVCVPCGYQHHYQPGDHFTECISCLSGTKDGHEDFVAGQEMWEPIQSGASHDASQKK